MKYQQYLDYQIEGPGMIKKPLHYRKGERRALDILMEWQPYTKSVLDVGCGTGTGLLHLWDKGFSPKYLYGIEINPKKAEMCRRKGLAVDCLDIQYATFARMYDIIWVSHVFEHMLDPELAIKKILELMHDYSDLYMIMPYPDTGPSQVHCASGAIGLREDDGGSSVVNWFESRGLYVMDVRFDDYREKEIWLTMEKQV